MSRKLLTAGPDVAEIAVRHPHLLLLDIDEVILHFIEPFRALLEELGARLSADSFHLNGNVRSIATGAAITGHELSRVTEQFYLEQESRQQPVDGVREALGELRESADIVFLTAMTPSHYAARRKVLDAHGLDFPMIATERSKGAIAAELMQYRDGRLVFVDDLPPNLVSVSRSVPQARLVHLMASDVFRRHLPPLPPGAVAATDWPDATVKIRQLLND